MQLIASADRALCRSYDSERTRKYFSRIINNIWTLMENAVVFSGKIFQREKLHAVAE